MVFYRYGGLLGSFGEVLDALGSKEDGLFFHLDPLGLLDRFFFRI